MESMDHKAVMQTIGSFSFPGGVSEWQSPLQDSWGLDAPAIAESLTRFGFRQSKSKHSAHIFAKHALRPGWAIIADLKQIRWLGHKKASIAMWLTPPMREALGKEQETVMQDVLNALGLWGLTAHCQNKNGLLLSNWEMPEVTP